MTMARPAWAITTSAPGSELAGETAAAMAAASILFKTADPSIVYNKYIIFRLTCLKLSKELIHSYSLYYLSHYNDNKI